MPIMVVKDDESKVLQGHDVPHKGSDKYGIEHLKKDLDLLGYTTGSAQQ